MGEGQTADSLADQLRELQEGVRRMDATSAWGSDAIRDAVVGFLKTAGLPGEEEAAADAGRRAPTSGLAQDR